ncbi:MAG: SDR family oxidoreductase [Pirellula sp.]|jgi:dihydroanticapsin dehydrogenase|nr:SDR family oxidoreductase [Pirellula sp.]
MEINLVNKIAILTGAASGVGLATTLCLLESGITGIVAVDLAAKAPVEFSPFMEGPKPRLVYVQGDVASDETVSRFVSAALEHYGQVDILINNAGVNIVKPIHTHSDQDWDWIMNTNVKAIFLAARQIVPVMLKQQSGLILNIGSISGLVGLKNQGAYAASKGAVHQMTRQMAIEYAASGIRVNTLALGTVDTPVVYSSAKQTKDPEAFIQGLRSQHPLGRIATADEVGKFIVFLSSDHATFFTGATLSLDGGFTAQ